MGTRRWVGWLLVVAVLLGGCSGGGGPASSPSDTVSGGASVSSSSSGGPWPVTSPVMSVLDWQAVGRWPIDGTARKSDGRYLVSGQLGEIGAKVVVSELESGRVLASDTAPAHFTPSEVFLAAPWVLVVHEPRWGPGLTVAQLKRMRPQVVRLDLRTGARLRADGRPGVPVVEAHDWSQDGRTVAYLTAKAGERGLCVVLLDIVTLAATTGSCSSSGWFLAWPRLSDTDVTVLEVEDREDEPRRRDKRLLVAPRAHPDQARVVPCGATCRPWSGVTVQGVTVWSELTEDAEVEGAFNDGEGFATTTEGFTTSLGRIDTGSIGFCAGWAVWSLGGQSGTRTQQRRWRPGSPVQVIFEVAEDSDVLSSLDCSPAERGSTLGFANSLLGSNIEEVYYVAPAG